MFVRAADSVKMVAYSISASSNAVPARLDLRFYALLSIWKLFANLAWLPEIKCEMARRRPSCSGRVTRYSYEVLEDLSRGRRIHQESLNAHQG
jgi:hypothetical protein